MLVKKFAYKRCFAKFFSNIKFYKYIRTKHTKKFKNQNIIITNKFVVISITSKTSIF